MMPLHPKEPPAILIVDNDLGFLVWLGLTLGGGGFVTVPATTSAQAREVIEEMRITVSLAVVNLSLPGMSEFCDAVKRGNPSVKLIGIQSQASGPRPAFKTDANHSRSKVGWVTLVRKLLGIEKATGAQ